jgi:phosphatidylglycerophosphate synthase
MMQSATIRREVTSRGSWWAPVVARFLTRHGVKPNQVSLASIGFGALCPCFVLWSARTSAVAPAVALLLASVLMILGRLLCNLFDGMIAVEGGLKSKSGEVFNEFPDRVSDTVMFVGTAYAILSVPWAPMVGWLAALAALLTAYCRVLGGALGLAQKFSGPMAKQHRMAVLALGLVTAAIERMIAHTDYALVAALLAIASGSLLTCALRLRAIVSELENAPEKTP